MNIQHYADKQDNWETRQMEFTSPRYDMRVVHKRGVLITNADCLSRQPQPPTSNEPLLPDWNKGDYIIPPQTAFAFMAVDTEAADTT